MSRSPHRYCVLCGRPLPEPRNWVGRLLDRINPPPPSCPPPEFQACHDAYLRRLRA